MTYNQLAAYYFLLATVIAIEHHICYARWRRKEWARWSLGVITVFIWSAPLALSGYLDVFTTIVLFIAFGLGGMVKGGMDIDRQIVEVESARDRITEQSDW